MKGHTYSKRNKAFVLPKVTVVSDKYCSQVMHLVAPALSNSCYKTGIGTPVERKLRHVMPRGKAYLKLLKLIN